VTLVQLGFNHFTYSFSLFLSVFYLTRLCSDFSQERNGEDWHRKTGGLTSRRLRGSESYTCKNIRITSTGRDVGSTQNGHPVHRPHLPRRPTPRATGPILPARRFIIPCKSILWPVLSANEGMCELTAAVNWEIPARFKRWSADDGIMISTINIVRDLTMFRRVEYSSP